MKSNSLLTRSLLVKAVLASSVFCALPMMAHAAAFQINENTTDLNGVNGGQGYIFESNELTLTIPHTTSVPINIGKDPTTGYSFDSNSYYNEAIVFTDNDQGSMINILGKVGSYNDNPFFGLIVMDGKDSINFKDDVYMVEESAFLFTNNANNESTISFADGVDVEVMGIVNTTNRSNVGNVVFEGSSDSIIPYLAPEYSFNSIVINSKSLPNATVALETYEIYSNTINLMGSSTSLVLDTFFNNDNMYIYSNITSTSPNNYLKLEGDHTVYFAGNIGTPNNPLNVEFINDQNTTLELYDGSVIYGPVTTSDNFTGILGFDGNSIITNTIGDGTSLALYQIFIHDDDNLNSKVLLDNNNQSVSAEFIYLQNNGTLQINGPIQTITVNHMYLEDGRLSFMPSANLNINQNGYGQFVVNNTRAVIEFDMAGDLNNTGLLTLNGNDNQVNEGTINILRPGYAPTGTDSRTIIQTSATNGSTFSDLPVTAMSYLSSFVTHVESDGTTLRLVLDTTSMPVSEGANQRNTYGVAEALDEIIQSGSYPLDFQFLIDQLGQFATQADLNAALASLAPRVNGDILEPLQTFKDMYDRVLLERMINRNSAKAFHHHGHNYGDMLDTRGGAWVKVIGRESRLGEVDDILGFKDNTWGVAAGGDMQLSEHALIGAGVSWSRNDIYNHEDSGKTRIDSYQIALYGDYLWDCPFYFNWMAGYAYNDFDTTRNVTFGDLFFTSKGDFDGNQFGAKAEFGYDYIERGVAHLIPFVSLYYTHLDIDSYTEEDVFDSAFTLEVDDQDYDLFQGGIGLRFAYDCPLGKEVFQPEIHATFLYDFSRDRVVIDSAFTEIGPEFTTEGVKLSRESYNLGAGFAAWCNESGLVFSASYDYNTRKGYHSNTGFIRLRYEW